MKMTADPTLAPLDRLVGTWATEATHPAMPGVVVRGTVVVEWLEGERFLIHRARTDHPAFPDAISIIGDMERDRVDGAGRDGDPAIRPASPWRMHYFDSRGVFRVYETSVTDEAWRWWREVAGFSQRFTGRFSDDGRTIAGAWELANDGVTWEHDFDLTYTKLS